MKKPKEPQKIAFTSDNPENIRKAMECYKNIVICGIKGVGKITNTVQAILDRPNVYYIGNPFDYEGKRRPGSYEKYLHYILSLKEDMKIVVDASELFDKDEQIILIVDEIYGRSEKDMEEIGRLYDRPNIHIFQIVGCLRSIGGLVEKADAVLQLHHDGAFIIDKEFAVVICRVLGKK